MKHAIPLATNRAIFSALLLLHAAALFALPALHAAPIVWLTLLTAMLWLTIVHWGLIHEAIHKLLFPDARANELGGRALAIAMGTSFHVLRFGHLMHHQWNRQFHSERDIAPTFTGRIYYYAHLLLGVYAMEVVASWLFLFLPRAQFMWLAHRTFLHDAPHVAATGERFFYVRGNIHETRTDVAIGLVLYGLAFALSGGQFLWLAAFVLLRAIVISFMDNIYHFDTPTDNSKLGKELSLPPLVSALMLHGNYHETHHANPDVPWRELPATHVMQHRAFDGDFVTHGLKQFKGPDWDELTIATATA